MTGMRGAQVLDGDGEQGERVRAEGVLELPAHWSALGEGFSTRLEREAPEQGGASCSVQVNVAVLELMHVPVARSTVDELDAFEALGEGNRGLLEALQGQGHLQVRCIHARYVLDNR